MISFKQFLLLESQLQDWDRYVSSNPMLKAAVEVLDILSRYGKAYIVGGCVRDIVLGSDPHDVDIATNVPMEKVEELFKSNDIGKNKSFGIVVNLKERYKDQGKKDQIKKVVNGQLVMDLLGIPPGKKVGEVVNATMEWILNNNIDMNDVDKIRAFILSQKL